jgi:uncharacterized membrane protein YheB (UPF0754 family)
MNLYNSLPNELQNKVDHHIQSNVKDFIKTHVQSELEQYHKNRLRALIIDYYNNFKKKTNFFVTNRMIENDLLMWLNHPHSQNMNEPFMSNKNTQRFKNVMVRLFSARIKNEKQYRFATKHLSGQQIVNKILDSLTIKELEKFYIYKMRWIGEYAQKHILQIPLTKYVFFS